MAYETYPNKSGKGGPKYASGSGGCSSGYHQVTSGKRKYAKGGQEGMVSSKHKSGMGQKSKEDYINHLNEPWQSVNGAPDAFERRYYNNYRKTSLPNQGEEDRPLTYGTKIRRGIR